MRQLCGIREKVCSITHLCGKAREPLGGINLCQPTSLPSLVHYLAQVRGTFSSASLESLRTTSNQA